MFTDTKTIHHVPLSALSLVVPAKAQDATNENGTAAGAAPYKVEHSFQMHQLMQDQYREVQELQKKYAEARISNPQALSKIQSALSTLRNRHLLQIQMLKQRQMTKR